MIANPIKGPSALAIGNAGELRIGGMLAGRLTQWRVVVSPSAKKEDGTPYFTLFAEGKFLRFFSSGERASLHLTPSPQPYRIGRPKPKTPKPFVLQGHILEFSASRIVVSEAEIAHG